MMEDIVKKLRKVSVIIILMTILLAISLIFLISISF
jgi:hypothetical protein